MESKFSHWWIVLLVWVVLTPEGLGNRQWHTEFGGSFKSIIARQSLRQNGLYSYNNVPFAEQRLRLQGAVDRSWLRIEIADEIDVYSQISNSSVLPIPLEQSNEAWKTTVDVVDQPGLRVRNRIDRAFVQVVEGNVEFVAGRQVIPNGVGHFFSAVNQIPGHALSIIDSEFQRAADAISIIHRGKSVLEGRFLPKLEGQQNHNFHFRAKGTFRDTDLAITTGRSDDKAYGGIESAVNLEDSLLRAEVVAYSYRQRAVFQGLLGIDHVFSSSWRGELELFYNGFGRDHYRDYQLLFQPHRSTPYLGSYYSGTALSWDITPVFTTTLYAVTNLVDRSTLMHLKLSYSVADDIDILAGQYLSLASHSRSEFGGQIPVLFGTSLGVPDMTYFVLKFYF